MVKSISHSNVSYNTRRYWRIIEMVLQVPSEFQAYMYLILENFKNPSNKSFKEEILVKHRFLP